MLIVMNAGVFSFSPVTLVIVVSFPTITKADENQWFVEHTSLNREIFRQLIGCLFFLHFIWRKER